MVPAQYGLANDVPETENILAGLPETVVMLTPGAPALKGPVFENVATLLSSSKASTLRKFLSGLGSTSASLPALLTNKSPCLRAALAIS